MTSALRDLGFEEDRGASCIKECAGSFKLQHDTGKNLKTVVVFPRIHEENAKGGNDDQGGSSEGRLTSLFLKSSPKEMIATSTKNVFETMVKSRCQTWSQKKECMASLEEIRATLETLDGKLLQGIPLTETEQAFYDQISSTVLEEKKAYVKDLLQHHVDDGVITAKEKTQLLSQTTERLEAISKQIADAEQNNQVKKIEKLKEAKEKIEARKEKLFKINPKPPPPLKHQAEIFQLRSELRPLLELEEGSKGRLLSVKETQSLARKDEILEDIANLVVREHTSWWLVKSREATCLSSPICWNCRKKAGDGSKRRIVFNCGLTPAIKLGSRKTGPQRKE